MMPEDRFDKKPFGRSALVLTVVSLAALTGAMLTALGIIPPLY